VNPVGFGMRHLYCRDEPRAGNCRRTPFCAVQIGACEQGFEAASFVEKFATEAAIEQARCKGGSQEPTLDLKEMFVRLPSVSWVVLVEEQNLVAAKPGGKPCMFGVVKHAPVCLVAQERVAARHAYG